MRTIAQKFVDEFAMMLILVPMGRVQTRVTYTEKIPIRVANRPGMAGIVPELTHGVPCPGRGSFCPGNVKIGHWAWISGGK